MEIRELGIRELGDAVFLGNYESGSEEWHKLRNDDAAIGGSDIGAIAGLSPWESAITKWAKKTGKISDERRTKYVYATRQQIRKANPRNLR
jgi:predicted phage-related endonuclease